jgi:hypothetical protein
MNSTNHSDSLPKLDKFCVFCGATPDNKNKEHPIPMWLIKATGDPHRVVPLINSKRPLSTFHFPSCEKCNSLYGGSLEVGAQIVVSKILNDQKITSTEINTLLDWLDKVRVGLWLASIYLGKNHVRVDQTTSHYIKPEFHISSRIAKRDRMVAIYKTTEKIKDLCFTGTDGWYFIKSPSCFALLVNHIVFFNVSIEFLLSKQLGLPYPASRTPQEDGMLGFFVVNGTEEISSSVFPFPIDNNCTKIYQPMLGDISHMLNNNLYDTSYNRDMCLDFERGIGKPFIELNGSISEYPLEPSHLWRPPCEMPAKKIMNDCFKRQQFVLKTIDDAHKKLWEAHGFDYNKA